MGTIERRLHIRKFTKNMNKIINSILPRKYHKTFVQVFEKRARSEKVNKEALEEIFKLHSIEPNNETAKTLLQIYNNENDEGLSKVEFRQMCKRRKSLSSQLKKYPETKKKREFFAMIDVNNDGVITFEELKHFMVEVAHGYENDRQIEEMIKLGDKNYDEKLQWKEFLSMCTRYKFDELLAS